MIKYIKLEKLEPAVDIATHYALKQDGIHWGLPTEPARNKHVGIELESAFAPGSTQARQIASWIKNQKDIPENFKKDLKSSNNIRAIVASYILPKITNLLCETPHYDGGGVESVLPPCTLKAHQVLKPEYAKIINIYKNFGFSDVEGGDGIHANIDKKLFGNTEEEAGKAFEMFLWFLYKNIDFMVQFSGRVRMYQTNSDLLSLLGDLLGLRSEEEQLIRFKSGKKTLVQMISAPGNNYGSGPVFNMTVNRDRRPCIEFRWFGSTHDINIFMSYIEFSFAIPEWSKTMTIPEQCTLQSFVEYVRARHEMYPHLLNRLLENSYVHELTLQQQVQRKYFALTR